MIYSVHFWYSKIGSRKAARKFEGIIFAKDRDHAEGLIIVKLIGGLPIKIDGMMSIVGAEKSLQEIYKERPELSGRSPEVGYIYNELYERGKIREYLK